MRVLDRIVLVGKKNDELSFLVKIMPKLVRLGHVGFMVANAVILDNVFSFKSTSAFGPCRIYSGKCRCS